MKYWKWGLLVLILAVSIIIGLNYPKLTIISGYAAKSLASSVHVAQREPGDVLESDHEVPLINLSEARVMGPNSAKATVFGLMERKAACRDGIGCVLLPRGMTLPENIQAPNRTILVDTLPYPIGDAAPMDTVFPEIDYERLEKALDGAFLENDRQRTRTVLILYKGRLLAERYVQGFSPDTPVLGWSMTKSLLATLYGILQYRGQISVEHAPEVPQWNADTRKDITYNNLLRMESGLEWDEDYSRISDVTRMLFLEKNMATVQAEKKAIAQAGEIWNYSSGTSNLLSGLLRNHFSTYQEYLDFPYEALIDKIGMHSMIVETDMAGNYVGSSYGWASTRDWGKFGLLYLNNGSWKGETIFAPEWVDYVSNPTTGSNGRYGAHFWLNAGGVYPGVPGDLYSANGYQGQYVFIIPSLDLVVVRTGLAEPPDFDLQGFLQSVVGIFSH